VRRALWLAPLLAACAVAPRAQELFPDDGAPQGWRVTAWQDLAEPAPDGAAWLVRDGVLETTGMRGSWLVSERSYSDFELEFEILLTMLGNSGVALRAPAAGDPAFDGLELQFVDLRYRPEALPSELTGGLYRALAPTQQFYAPERWNACRIRAVGPRVQVWLNGALVLDADLDAQTANVPRHDGSAAPPLRERLRAGRIGFQHLSRDGAVRIRGVRLRELRAPRADELLAAARAAWRLRPADEECIVWYGRRVAYQGNHEEAIAIYTDGLLHHPDSVALLRHRGHRQLSLRRFDAAIADLERASALARGRPDAIEPDGLPNAAGIPRSTLHGNVEYHLALALDLRGRRAEAEAAWRRALALATNDDTLCAGGNWLYLNLLAQGREQEARALLTAIRGEMEILENFAYHELLLFDKDLRTAEEVLRGHAPGSVEYATRSYGLAARFATRGETGRAVSLAREAVRHGPAAAFGVIAAEVLLTGLPGLPGDPPN
jgi:Flp pilus assembly protein TadD